MRAPLLRHSITLVPAGPAPTGTPRTEGEAWTMGDTTSRIRPGIPRLLPWILAALLLGIAALGRGRSDDA